MSSAKLESVQFLWNNIVCQLQLKEGFLLINCLKKLNTLDLRPLSTFNKKISISSILVVESGLDCWKIQEDKSLIHCNFKNLLGTTVSTCHFLTLHIAAKTKKRQLRLQNFKLQTCDEKDSSGWKELLTFEVEKTLKSSQIIRPKKLLVFVNPYGGKKNAVSIHKSIVKPIFQIAGIEETVVITERRNHAKDHVETADLTQYDGVITIGGDGMLNEIVNGVLIAAQRRHNISLDGDDDSLLSKPIEYVGSAVKLGLIPAGSTNCVSYVSQGLADPETATLQVVCGESHYFDVCSIHDDIGKFVRFSFSMTSYGYFGHVLEKSEHMRKLGPHRYDVAGVNAFAQMKSRTSEVAFLLSSPDNPVDLSKDKTRCRYPCDVCSACTTDKSQSMLKRDITDSQVESFQPSTSFFDRPFDEVFGGLDGWQVSKGDFPMVNSALMSCACTRCPEGLSPSAHLSDGNTDLILVRTSSRFDLLKYLVSHIGKANRLSLPFVEAHRVRGFHHKASKNADVSSSGDHSNTSTSASVNKELMTGCWNTDGEIIENPNITLWVHNGLVNLFARGIE